MDNDKNLLTYLEVKTWKQRAGNSSRRTDGTVRVASQQRQMNYLLSWRSGLIHITSLSSRCWNDRLLRTTILGRASKAGGWDELDVSCPLLIEQYDHRRRNHHRHHHHPHYLEQSSSSSRNSYRRAADLPAAICHRTCHWGRITVASSGRQRLSSPTICDARTS